MSSIDFMAIKAAVSIEDTANVLVLGDNAFRDPLVAQRLKQGHNITVVAPPRRTYARVPWPVELRQLVNRVRRRIESALSVLAVVFNLEHPGSRSARGLITRVASRILTYTISFLASAILQPEQN